MTVSKRKSHLSNTPEYRRAYRAANRERYRSSNRKWREKNREIIREKAKRKNKEKKYGISYEEYLLHLDVPVCPLCLKRDVKALDHCHETGKIRGPLCIWCNTALGSVEDNIEILERMILYLKEKQLDGSQETTISPF
jgi:hypothetical protein